MDGHAPYCSPPMHSEPDRAVTGYQPGSPRQRVISSLLSAGLILLALLLVIYGSGVAIRSEKRDSLATFDVSGRDENSGAEARSKPKDEKTRKAEAEHQEHAPPVVTPTPAETRPAFSFLKMSHDDFVAADIGRMKSPGLAQGGAPGGGSGGSYGPGEGPGGAVLYRAEWHREPSDAQLGGYLPAGGPASGWGEIACQTIEDYRVENCQILAESPRGSGFARAVQEAAWQFQVVPPRVNGKPQIGTWVRIRIDYGTKRAG